MVLYKKKISNFFSSCNIYHQIREKKATNKKKSNNEESILTIEINTHIFRNKVRAIYHNGINTNLIHILMAGQQSHPRTTNPSHAKSIYRIR